MKDKIAFANAATTGFIAHNTDRSAASYAVEACVKVLRDTGLGPNDIDGIVGSSQPSAGVVQRALGVPEITYYANPMIPFVNQTAAAMGAVAAGICEVVLAYHAPHRSLAFTASAARDPFRRSSMFGGGGGRAGGPGPDSTFGAVGYTAWASRYMHDYGTKREYLGYVAVNDRSNAVHNPAAAMREPITMDDYLNARMVREPLCLLDMDVPVDGADAFIITTAERAADMPHKPVLIHAAALGQIDKNVEDQTPSLERHGQQVVIEALKSRSDFWIDDVDVYFPYDGFTIITLNWIENAGYCGRGEAGEFLAQHWDHESNRVLINGRVPINSNGGGLSEGGTQGSGHIREAVHQLQGRAESRQVPGATKALVTPGGFFFNAQGLTLRTD